jgi:polyphenol oxidase
MMISRAGGQISDLGTDGAMTLVLPEVEQHAAVAAFSLRSGGCSPPPFDTLNFSAAQGDASRNVQENLALLGAKLRLKPARIATCHQVHGDHVAVLDSIPDTLPVADALVTRLADLYPAVRTADCVPILVLDPIERVSAAIHAGWRGTVKRITQKVLRLMQSRFGTRPENVVAAVGPAIQRCCYEVDETVLDPFRGHIPDAERFIAPGNSTKHRRQRKATAPRPGGGQNLPPEVPHARSGFDPGEPLKRAFLDLVGTNRWELLVGGVFERNIHVADFCTCCTPELLFSYRRDGARSGRHIALTGFRE